MNSEVYTLQKWLRESENTVFISGRDLSAEAGVPDYREMEEGFLDTYQYAPDTMLSLTFLKQYPFYFFKYYRDRILAPVMNATPGPTHEILARLERAGKLKAILTTNIDGLHQEAGSREVLELHGSILRSWCAKCDKYLDFSTIADSPTPVPYCQVDMCGDIIRPAIVLREEPYDMALLEKAMDYARRADVLLIDGSALEEFPVPNLMQCYEGHKLILFNTPPLIFDARAGLLIHAPMGEVFSQLAAEL